MHFGVPISFRVFSIFLGLPLALTGVFEMKITFQYSQINIRGFEVYNLENMSVSLKRFADRIKLQ